jgi:hypothetical protein
MSLEPSPVWGPEIVPDSSAKVPAPEIDVYFPSSVEFVIIVYN